MKKSEAISLVREVMLELEEANTSAATPGYSTPFAFGKGTRAKNVLKKLGYKKVSRPKRPSNTKLVDYLWKQ